MLATSPTFLPKIKRKFNNTEGTPAKMGRTINVTDYEYLNAKAARNPMIQLVKSLDLGDKNGFESIQRGIDFEVKRQRIDANEEIRKRRLGKLILTKKENVKLIDKRVIEGMLQEEIMDTENKIEAQKEKIKVCRKKIKDLYNLISKSQYELESLESGKHWEASRIAAKKERLIKERAAAARAGRTSINQMILSTPVTENTETVNEEENLKKNLIKSTEVNQDTNSPKKKQGLVKKESFQIFQQQNELANKDYLLTKKTKKLKKGIENAKLEIKSIEAEIKPMTDELHTHIEKLKEFKQKLSDHYHLLLYEGLDFGSEGLSALIKEIWKIGKNVDVNYMPSFLDKHSVDFLFTRARHSLQMEKVKESIKMAKDNLGQKFLEGDIYEDNEWLYRNDQMKKTESKFFNTRLGFFGNKDNKLDTNQLVSKFMASYSKKKNKEDEKYTLKNIKSYMKKQKNFKPEIVGDVEYINKLGDLLKVMENQLEVEKQEEVERICKEFLANGYEQKYKVCPEVMLCALCGDENKTSQLICFTKYKRQYNEDITKTRFFCLGNRRLNNTNQRSKSKEIKIDKDKETI